MHRESLLGHMGHHDNSCPDHWNIDRRRDQLFRDSNGHYILLWTVSGSPPGM